jgi:hypothetical protein
MSTEDLPDMLGDMRGAHPMLQMSVFGYLIGGLVLLVMLPLLPFLLLYVAYGRVARAVTG